MGSCLSRVFRLPPTGKAGETPRSSHGRVRLADDAPRRAAEHVPGVGLVVDGPDPGQPLMAVLLGGEVQHPAHLNLRLSKLDEAPGLLKVPPAGPELSRSAAQACSHSRARRTAGKAPRRIRLPAESAASSC